MNEPEIEKSLQKLITARTAFVVSRLIDRYTPHKLLGLKSSIVEIQSRSPRVCNPFSVMPAKVWIFFPILSAVSK